MHSRILTLRLRLGLLLFAICSSVVSRVEARETTPSIYISCPSECYEDYLRQELSYFDFVRDRFLSDVNLVISRQAAGNGGQRYTIVANWTAEAREKFGVDRDRFETSFLVPPAATPDEARSELSQATLQILYRSLEHSPEKDAFQLSVPPRDGEVLSGLADPWNYFVLVPELSIGGEGASEYHFLEGKAALTVRRTTEAWRLRLRGAYGYDWNSVVLEDGSRISATIPSWEGRALSAHSLGRRWALGGLATVLGGEYENYEFHLHAAPGVEFNIFPYEQNASQQLRFVYQAGAWWSRYIEPNEEDLMEEVRPYHALSLISDMNQAWGSLQWIIQGNQFLDDLALWRVSTGATLSLALTDGLSFNVEGQFAWVEDQINLRGRPVTDEELLLWTVEQPTSFTFEGHAGLSYTFGSRHNNIVNPRFGRVDLAED